MSASSEGRCPECFLKSKTLKGLTITIEKRAITTTKKDKYTNKHQTGATSSFLCIST